MGFKRSMCAVVLGMIGVISFYARGNADGNAADEQFVQLSVRRLDGKELIEVKMADLSLVVPEAHFAHDNNQRTTVTVKEGKVLLRTAAGSTLAKEIRIKYPNGPLSRKFQLQ